MHTIENAVRTLRVVHLAMLASVLLYAVVGEVLKRPALLDTQMIFPILALRRRARRRGLLVLAVAQIEGILFFRSRLVGPAADVRTTLLS